MAELVGRIAALFSGSLSKLKNEYYLRPAFNMVNMIIINFGIENTDAIQKIHHIYQTSWGESYIDEYATPESIVSILEKIIKEGALARQKFDDYCVIISPEPFKKHYKEIEQIFREAYQFIIGTDKRFSFRFVARLGGMVVIATRDGDSVLFHHEADIIKALTRISLNPRKQIVYSWYSSDPRLQLMDAIFKTRKKNYITAVIEESGDSLLVYVINERDNIFTFVKPLKTREDVVVFLVDFCNNVVNRINKLDRLHHVNQGLQLMQLTVDRFGKSAFENKSHWAEELYLVKYKTRKAFCARVSKYKGTETLYALARQGETGQALVPLKGVPVQAGDVRKSDGSVALAIQDLVFSDLKEDDIHLGSTPYFVEKYRLELMMGKALR